MHPESARKIAVGWNRLHPEAEGDTGETRNARGRRLAGLLEPLIHVPDAWTIVKRAERPEAAILPADRLYLVGISEDAFAATVLRAGPDDDVAVRVEERRQTGTDYEEVSRKWAFEVGPETLTFETAWTTGEEVGRDEHFARALALKADWGLDY
jgi:hypothetical protein